MTLARLVADAVELLERSEIPYMVSGSVASSYHGEPRAISISSSTLSLNPSSSS